MNNRKYYEAKGKMEQYRDVTNRWKTGYRMRTGSFKYTPREWEKKEDDLVLAHKMSDRELSELIHRSVLAIQIRRSRLKSGSV